MEKETSLTIGGMVTSIDVPERWLEKRNTMLALATATTDVDNQIQFDDGSELLNSITKHSNALEKQRKEFSAPFSTAAKNIKKMCDDERAELETEKGRIKLMLAKYAAAQAKKQLEERRRIEAAERAEASRKFAEQQKAQAEADLLGLDSEPEKIEVKRERMPYVEQAHSQSSRISKRLVWQVEDEDKIPVAFKTLDSRKVNEFTKNAKEEMTKLIEAGKDGNTFIAGIVFEIKTDVIGR